VALVGLGVAGIGFGVAVLAGGHTLAGVAGIGLGVAIIGLGVAALARGSAVQRVRAWWDTMTADPDELPAADTTAQPLGPNDERSLNARRNPPAAGGRDKGAV
jgi:hypothetical protein